jgi:hypothetical protein
MRLNEYVVLAEERGEDVEDPNRSSELIFGGT